MNQNPAAITAITTIPPMINGVESPPVPPVGDPEGAGVAGPLVAPGAVVPAGAEAPGVGWALASWRAR
jgi:hypothetical protein